MTIMMSEALVGRLDPKCLDPGENEDNRILLDISIEGYSFSCVVNTFKRNSSSIIISFTSPNLLVESLMKHTIDISGRLRRQDSTLFEFNDIKNDNCEIEINLSSNESYVDLSICLV